MCLMSGYDIMIFQTQKPMGLELTHSLTPCKFGDSSQGLSLFKQKIEAVSPYFAEVQDMTTY